ncbi:MAG TPA: hypothetical protein VMY99_02080 [Nevskiaceae bacterium]|nr:hypothetical protein [Nevskiaceae bacterium]
MEALKALGVRHLEHTLEVIDDKRREHIMPKRAKNPAVLNKGEVTFDQVLASIPDGVAVFGADRYTATMLIGLDDFQTSVAGLRALREAGLSKLSSPVFQTYTYSGLRDYAMSFSEVMETRRMASRLFARQY